VEQTRRAGLDVSLTTDGALTGLPARVELSAYRIVQESLTNVLKHAGPGARTDVRLTNDGRSLLVEVTDDGSGATVLPGAGHGLVGMRERALLLGGSLDVGPGSRRWLRRPRPAAPGRHAPMSIRVVVVDDQALVRGGFAMVLDHQSDIEVVAEAGNGVEAVPPPARTGPTWC
jgi:hypothetical protein